ncbi:hypothetical protein QMZ05_17890 [Bradyrhizobium sp. INPA03-11B]|uniref:hypothetical protein n=1 Tax=Bradyrhizobium sp. INPA03-11B TaxID=418598 RepID=UPI00338E8FB1
MTFASGEAAQIAAGRACGKCSLCCKVVRVDKLAKPPGVWCKDCAPGKGGCKIYESRPEECQHFLYMWLYTEELGAEWYPATAKFVVAAEQQGNRIAVSVDPSFPTKWREEPYYSQIKGWAQFGATVNSQVIVNIGKRVIVVLPNKEVDLAGC